MGDSAFCYAVGMLVTKVDYMINHTFVLQIEGMQRPGIAPIGDIAQCSAVGVSVSFDKILTAVLDHKDEVLYLYFTLIVRYKPHTQIGAHLVF